MSVLVLAIASGQAQVGEPTVGATAVTWRPSVENEGFVLIVSGPDGVVRRAVPPDEQPTFELFDARGKTRSDGCYTWELRANPLLAAEDRDRLAAARASGDEKKAEEILAELRAAGRLPLESALVQTGAFAVEGGAFVPLDASEPESRTGSPKRTKR
jgi:hypothetical protein